MKTHYRNMGIFLALLLTGMLLTPPDAKAHSPRARELCGVIQAMDLQAHTLTVQSLKRDQPSTFTVRHDTQFIQDWKPAAATSLQQGLWACVYYHSPFFGKPFVTKVVWVRQN